MVKLVATREIRERGRSTALRVGTVISLLLVAAAVAIPTLHHSGRPTFRVGLVGPASQSLMPTIRRAGAAVDAVVDPVAEPDEAAAERDLRSGRINVAVIDRQRLVVDKQIDSGDTSSRAVFVSELSREVSLQAGLEQAGIPADQTAGLINPVPLPVRALKPASKNSSERITVFYGILLLLMLVQQYGYWLLLGVVEEKSTRVVEVLLATIKPDELLLGKTIGIGALALGQAVALLAVALVVAAATGSALLKGAAVMGLLVAVLWFILGYTFYCSLYAAGGSLASRTEDAQNIAFPLQLPLLLAYFTSFSALFSGTASPLVHVLAFFPPTAPIAMPVLVATGSAGPVSVAVSVLLTLAAAVLLMRVAAGIYRRAILRTGRRVKVREVLRRAAA